jgi:ABC-type branched-subunit amino acid transport system substrate-binding protein
MTLRIAPTRRGALRSAIGLAAIAAAPALWAQVAQSGGTAQSVVVAQAIDSSVGQLEVSRDFLIGSRAAWQEINARGGVNGRLVKHLVIEVDGSTAGLRAALNSVKAYRETLGRLFDEPATPQSLAGYIAARYTGAVLNTLEGTPTRQSVLQAFQLRNSIDISGFRVSFNALGRGGSYVTQSMVTPDGRLIG